MQMSGQLHVPADLAPRKEPLLPTGATEPAWTLWHREKIFLPFPESNSGRRAHNPVTILTELSRPITMAAQSEARTAWVRLYTEVKGKVPVPFLNWAPRHEGV
jgi:hypothetical protein